MNNITLIKKKYYWIFALLLSFCFSNVQAQTAPVNSRFMQVNTPFNPLISGPQNRNIVKSYVKHLNSQKNDLFFTCSIAGNVDFFGQQADPSSRSRHIARLGEDGLPRWTANFSSESGMDELNQSSDFACVDKDDNFLFLSNPYEYGAAFTDASGSITNFNTIYQSKIKALVKVDKNGNYLWSKKIIINEDSLLEGAITTDGNGDVYLILSSYRPFTIDNVTLGVPATSTLSVIKLNASDGSILYSKNYNYSCFNFIPVFDAQNNLYAFTEPLNLNGNYNYTFDSIIIPGNTQDSGHLMLKFNAAGDVVFGKDFYAGASSHAYSWPNDVIFDGTNFILNGTLYAEATEDFKGLDGLTIPRSYTGIIGGIFAKIDTSGNVLWQKDLGISDDTFLSYSNIDLDENDNFYIYQAVKDKLKINGTEYTYDAVKGEKVLIKFDTNGNQSYLKPVDYGTQKSSIDVFGVDKINVTSCTDEFNVLNHPVNNLLASNAYIATFGIIDTPYLTAEKNHAILNNAIITNNENNDNTFSFDLINNVNWTATSDQAWLNVSHLNLTGKNTLSTIDSGTGDAKITLTADTNNTAGDRSAIVTLSGNGVASKTILVTQSGNLGTSENEFNVLELILYPNPAQSTITFSAPVKAIEIIDISGKTIKTFQNLTTSFDISNIAKGIYFIKGKTQGDILFTKKVIKE